MRKTRKEEEFHRQQYARETVNRHVDYAALSQDPDVKRALDAIHSRFPEYDDSQVAYELGAVIGTRGGSELGMTPEQSNRAFNAYYNHVVARHGEPMRGIINYANPAIRKQYQENAQRVPDRQQRGPNAPDGADSNARGGGEGGEDGDIPPFLTRPARHQAASPEERRLTILDKLKKLTRDDVNANAWGAIGNVFNRNLSQTSKVSPEVDAALIKLASFQARAAAVLNAATPPMEKALKESGIALPQVFQTFVESRLIGTKGRWNDFADMARSQSLEQLKENLPGYINLLDTIEGRADMPTDLAQAATYLAQEEPEALGEFLASTFEDAADRVTSVMPADEYHAITGNPAYQEAKRIYKATAEKEMASSHEEHEGVFSTALGPEDTYFPLMPVVKHPGAGMAMPYVAPKNMANMFATGLSPEYDWAIESFRKKLVSAFHSSDKFAALQTMQQAGWLQPEPRGGAPRYVDPEGNEHPGRPAFMMPDGRMLPGKSVPISKERMIMDKGKFVRLPPRSGTMPLFMYQEAEPILEGKGYDDPTNAVSKIIHGINSVAVAGIAEPIYHGRNVAGGLISNLPFIVKALGDIKYAKLKGDLAKADLAFNLHPTTEEFAQDIIEMSKLGIVPDRYGRMAMDARTAELMGADKAPWYKFLSVALFGARGLDIKARWMMYRTMKYLMPNAAPREMNNFVNQLGNYTYGLQGRMERFLKHVGISPFYTAGSTGIRRGIKTWTGIGQNPIPGWKGTLLHQLVMGGLVATIAWAIAYHAMTGKWPWPIGTDRTAKLGYLPMPHDLRRSPIGNALWGKGPEIGEINMFAWHPDYGRGARFFGLPAAMQTSGLHGTKEQVLESAGAQFLDTVLQPIMGPAPRAAIAGGLGTESSLQGVRDREGRMGPQLFRAVPKKTGGVLSTTGWRASAALKEMNSFYHNVGLGVGLLAGKDLSNPDEKGSHIVRGISNLAAPGLFGGGYNPAATQKFLQEQKRAMGDR